MSARLEEIVLSELAVTAPGCSTCGGSGWQQLAAESGGQVVRRCPQPEHLRSRLANLGVPPRYQEFTLTGFTPRTVTAGTVRRQVQEHARQFTRHGQGLVLHGPAGTGKTHLAVGYMRALLENSQAQPRFVNSNELLRDLDAELSLESREARRYLLETVMDTELLVLDNLTATLYPEAAQHLLDYIISYRHRQLLPVLITTRLSLPELRLALSDGLYSRLAEMCEPLSL